MRPFSLAVFLLCGLALAQPRRVTLGLMVHDPTPGIMKPDYPMVETAVNLAIEHRRTALKKAGLEVAVETYTVPEDPLRTLAVIKKILAGNTVAGIGLVVSLYAAIGGPALLGSDYALVSPYATSTDLIKYYPNLSLFSATNTQLAGAVESFVVKNLKSKKTAAIVAWDRPYCKNFFESFSEPFRARVRLFKVLEDRTDSNEVADRIMQDPPDSILIPNFAASVAPYIRALSKRGYKGSFVGGDSWGEEDNGDLVKLTSGLDFEGYTVRQYSRLNLSPAAIKIKKELESRSDEVFRIVPLIFYDTASYLLDQLVAAGSNTSRASVLLQIQKTTAHKGVTGHACLSPGACAEREFTILRVNGNGYSFYGKHFR